MLVPAMALFDRALTLELWYLIRSCASSLPRGQFFAPTREIVQWPFGYAIARAISACGRRIEGIRLYGKQNEGIRKAICC